MLLASFSTVTSLNFDKGLNDTVVQLIVITIYGGQFLYFLSLSSQKVEKKEGKSKKSKKNENKDEDNYSDIEVGENGILAHIDMSKGKTSLFYLALLSLVNTIVSGVVIFMMDRGFQVLVLISVLFVAKGLYAIIFRPTKHFRLNLFELMISLVIALIYGLLLLMESRIQEGKQGITEKQIFFQIGIPAVIISLVVVVMAMTNGCYSILNYSSYIQKVRGKKEERI